jgi:hypothetical protein
MYHQTPLPIVMGFTKIVKLMDVCPIRLSVKPADLKNKK